VAKTPVVAAGVAFTGLILSAAFNRLDFRNRELVKIGERSLRLVEQRYQEWSGWAEVRLVDRAERPGIPFLGTFRWSIMFIEFTLASAFLAGAIYALVRI
jgi:hypothetical protein